MTFEVLHNHHNGLAKGPEVTRFDHEAGRTIPTPLMAARNRSERLSREAIEALSPRLAYSTTTPNA